MSKKRQLSALVNFVSRLRANRTKARTRAFMRWRLNLEASRAAAAERLSSQILARAAAASARGQRLACVVLASTMLKSWRRSAFRRWRRPRRISLERPTKAIEYRPAEGDRSPTTPVTPPRAIVTWSAPATPSTPLRDRAADRGFNRIASPAENREEAAAAARIAQVGRKIQRLFDAYGDQGLMNQYSFGLMAVDCALVPTLTDDVDEVIAVLGPKEELDFEDFCLALARVGLAHGTGRVAGEADPIRALLVVIASSDGFAQAQRTPSRKSLRDFSPPSPMAALQL
ncbi:unnamed protein product [Pelagomonas calceolata]|uniref:Uncharacterized protein n=1 Tax=Pelagomonas calceolata TaxID=35677 RepID=A0A8J2T1Z8_9STRA|nr:unnamed protein product [Pelagomonas calceolata]